MPGIFTGNGSVEWSVEANNVREALSRLDPPDREKPRRVVQRGIDETDPDEYFTIEIKLPRDDDERKVFIKELTDQMERLSKTRTLTLRLPIEDKRHNKGEATRKQIVVAWPSSPTAAATRSKKG